MLWITEILRGVDWNSPQVVILTALLLTFAIMRRWFLLAMTLLVVTLGRGLCNLQLNCAVLPDGGLTLATVVYVVSSILVITIAAVEFFVKE